jgi:hypothetical protein
LFYSEQFSFSPVFFGVPTSFTCRTHQHQLSGILINFIKQTVQTEENCKQHPREYIELGSVEIYENKPEEQSAALMSPVHHDNCRLHMDLYVLTTNRRSV